MWGMLTLVQQHRAGPRLSLDATAKGTLAGEWEGELDGKAVRFEFFEPDGYCTGKYTVDGSRPLRWSYEHNRFVLHGLPGYNSPQEFKLSRDNWESDDAEKRFKLTRKIR